MKTFRVALAIVVLLGLAGCGAPEPTYLAVIDSGGPEPSGWTPPPAVTPKPVRTTTSSKPTKIRAVLDMAVVVGTDGTVTVHAESNLPDGTELGSSVFEEGGYMAQDSQVLAGGAADFGPFSKDGGPVPAGTYRVSVTMPIAEHQPDAVKAIIGQRGEYLTGPQVKQAYGSATVHAVKELSIK